MMFGLMIRKVKFTGCQFSAPELLLQHNHNAPITSNVLPANPRVSERRPARL